MSFLSARCTAASLVTSRTSSRHARRGRHALQVSAAGGTSWDPEGLFKDAPRAGLIDRKLVQKEVANDKQYDVKMLQFAEAERAELQKKRDARKVPTIMEELTEYFLDTEAPEMEFEIARCRPLITAEYFAFLDTRIGLERFATVPDEDRLAELEGLREYLKAAVEAVDTAAASLAAPQERLKRLLEAKDKKAMLLEMAGNNEVDRAFIDLLDQNIEGATAAKNEPAADFMRKVKQAALRYLV
ncbi:hypothetical protein D9Q98_006344 [Chlorella vulgaris]|uniref:Uncharacterized protein n=1 Tax=Chlorella vulgaris TaxID=3077 RepID=A0A9D4TK43_CHLVU|nr:hypothetical protein D9Q98_006344 [Chlorella vulgaris]